MKNKKNFLAIVVAALWISVSEFLRNQIMFHGIWLDHYENLGLSFPSQPINGALWGLWSLIFAAGIYMVSRKFTYWQSVILCWVFGFLLMWLVIGNLSVLPSKLLWFAVPLSIIEVLVATWLVTKIDKPASSR